MLINKLAKLIVLPFHRRASKGIKGHQRESKGIKGNQRPSKLIVQPFNQRALKEKKVRKVLKASRALKTSHMLIHIQFTYTDIKVYYKL